MTAVFLQGNSRDVLAGLPADYFHCCVTSPPYFGLRRYSGGEEIWSDDGMCGHECGNEPTPDLYIQHLVQICREVKRVLRPDGVFWLNIGDSWAANRSYQVQQTKWQGMDGQEGQPARVPDGCKPLDMVLIPSLLALALRADGWYLRSQVVWSKVNPMPESVNGTRWERHKVKVARSARADTDSYHSVAYGGAPMGAREGREFANHDKEWQDCSGCPKCSPNDGYVLRKGSWRPTDSYEIILMLTKTDSYYCDKEAVLEPIAPSTIGRGKVDFGGAKGREYQPDESDPNFRNGSEQWGREYDYRQSNGNGGRNLRSVWEFPTRPYSGAHFATYPPRLVELCVESSTSEKGCCSECGAPWARVVEKGDTPHDGTTACKNYNNQDNTRRLSLMRQAARERGGEYVDSSRGIGWRPTCSCLPAPSEPCRVLDPFSGAGTTALVCERLGLDSIGIDTSSEYIQLAQTRLQEDEDKRVAEFIKQARKK